MVFVSPSFIPTRPSVIWFVFRAEKGKGDLPGPWHEKRSSVDEFGGGDVHGAPNGAAITMTDPCVKVALYILWFVVKTGRSNWSFMVRSM